MRNSLNFRFSGFFPLFLLGVAAGCLSAVGQASDSVRWTATTAVFDEATGLIAPQPWPQAYHDPLRTGRTDIVGPQAASLKRTYRSLGVTSGPVVARNGRAYVTMRYCIYSIPDGCLLFSQRLAVFTPLGPLRFFQSRIRLRNPGLPALGFLGTLYMQTLDGLIALTQDGRVRWLFPDATSAPAIGLDGTIYASESSLSSDSRLHALNPDGTLKWTVILPDRPFTFPAIGVDGSIYYGSVDRHLTALTADGVLKWRFPTGDQMHAPPSVALDGTVYAAGNDLFALAPDGSLKWSYGLAASSLSGATPAIGWDGSLYVPAGDRIIALTPDGNEKWEFPARRISESLVVDGEGTLFFAGLDGFFALTPEGALKWYLPAGGTFGLTNVTLTMGGDGTLYGATSGTIYALGSWPATAEAGQSSP